MTTFFSHLESEYNMNGEVETHWINSASGFSHTFCCYCYIFGNCKLLLFLQWTTDRRWCRTIHLECLDMACVLLFSVSPFFPSILLLILVMWHLVFFPLFNHLWNMEWHTAKFLSARSQLNKALGHTPATMCRRWSSGDKDK